MKDDNKAFTIYVGVIIAVLMLSLVVTIFAGLFHDYCN